jgi:hypothetical protein
LYWKKKHITPKSTSNLGSIIRSRKEQVGSTSAFALKKKHIAPKSASNLGSIIGSRKGLVGLTSAFALKKKHIHLGKRSLIADEQFWMLRMP